MRSLLSQNSIPAILIFTVISLLMVLAITFYVAQAKKKAGLNILYLLLSAIFIGIIGIRATAINNPFYFYIVIMVWNLLFGLIHVFLSKKILVWPGEEAIGWRLLFAVATVIAGFAGLLTFMQFVDYDFLVLYNLSAIMTFLIPTLIQYAYETFLNIPQKIFLAIKPWIYNRGGELRFKSDEISHFFLIKYRLSVVTGGEIIDSAPMRAPGNLRLGDYFNATLEGYKVTRGTHTIEVRDLSNKNLSWFFFLHDGKSPDRMLDPNKTFIECGLTDPVYFGNSGPDEIEAITDKADSEGKSVTILCKRELEYKSQLLQP
jgi:hypothetical protein